jgi:flagellar hook assembly protein FlgD
VEQGKVSIQIYNAIGQFVEKIVNKEFAAGTYNVTWNADNIPSGVYFYSITSNNFRQTKKMLLLK